MIENTFMIKIKQRFGKKTIKDLVLFEIKAANILLSVQQVFNFSILMRPYTTTMISKVNHVKPKKVKQEEKVDEKAKPKEDPEKIPKHLEPFFNEPTHNDINVYTCAYCKNTKSLKTCSKCRLISFCNDICLRNHWPKHKDICRPISALMRADKVNTVFKIQQKKREDGSIVMTAQSLRDAIVLLSQMLPSLLKRKLSAEETLVCFFVVEFCFPEVKERRQIRFR